MKSLKKLFFVLCLFLLSLTSYCQTQLRTNQVNLKIYNVLDYMADGTASSVTTTRLQGALDAAHANANGGEVFIPPGKYLTDGLTTYNNVIIVGESRFNTILKANSAITILTITNTGSNFQQDGVFIKELQFDGNSGTGTAAISITQLARAQYQSLYIHDFTTYGIYGLGLVEVSITNATIVNCGTGIYLNSTLGELANLISLYDCQIQYCTVWGINWNNGSGLYLQVCDFEHNGTANNLSTGSLNVAGMGYYGEGVGLVMDGGWFEENNGTSINIGSRPSNSVGSTFTRCVLHNVQIENALTGTTQGIYITSTNTSIPQYLDLYSCTIYGHTTDVTTDEGAITTNSNSKIGVHSETNGGTYATSVTTATGIPFSSVTSTPTTVAGYGITNAVTAWGDYIPSAQALSIGITGNLYIGGTSLFASNVQINAPLTISQFSQSKSGGSSLVGEATLVSGTITFTNYNVGSSIIGDVEPIIIISRHTPGGTLGQLSYSISGNNLIITSSSSTETSTVDYLIIN